MLAGRLRASLALTGGVHTPLDAVKAVLAGADAVQMVSALMTGGPAALARVRAGFEEWGDRHGFASIGAMRGAASAARTANPIEYERANYLEVLRAARRAAIVPSH
jgi:dihydroorotate dehydrogenase (fumarate)